MHKSNLSNKMKKPVSKKVLQKKNGTSWNMALVFGAAFSSSLKTMRSVAMPRISMDLVRELQGDPKWIEWTNNFLCLLRHEIRIFQTWSFSSIKSMEQRKTRRLFRLTGMWTL
jgi:hypothetical protein